jgi:hypothetical protein
VRAKETTVFIRENARRLEYVRPEWSTPRLLAAQIENGLGFFNRYPDRNMIWPTGLPLFPPVLAALTLLGLYASMLKVGDARLFLLALWFWAGFIGVIVTVETPNMHRSATAIPVLGLFAGLVLDETARRIGGVSAARASPRPVRHLGTALAGGAAVALAAGQLAFYFGPYAHSDRWPWTRVEGATVASEGKDGWAITLGSYAHMVNSGWVRLLAPQAHRLSIPTPGLELPLALPAERDLSFLLYSGQPYYLPYLEQIYPGGTSREAVTPDRQQVVTVYRVPVAKWEGIRGALASVDGAAAVRVRTLGEAPAGWTRFPSPARWSAALRVPNYGNYSFRASGRVSVDGRNILSPDPGKPFAETTVELPEGDHRIVFEGTVEAPGRAALFEWRGDAPGEAWRRTLSSELRAVDGPPQGLLGICSAAKKPDRKRLDAAIATMSLGSEVGLDGEWTATWRGTLLAPADGDYQFGFRTHGGTVDMRIDGHPLWTTQGDGEKVERGPSVALTRGPHQVTLTYRVVHSPGAIDWIWTPPGQRESLVPPAALRPPADAVPDPPLSEQTLSELRWYRHASDWMFVP